MYLNCLRVTAAAARLLLMPRAGAVDDRPKSEFVSVRVDRPAQTMRGFGFSHAFWTARWHELPSRDEIDYRLFHDLRSSIVRLHNAHGLGAESEGNLNPDAAFLASACTILGYAPHVPLAA
jgi:hypothetical protein